MIQDVPSCFYEHCGGFIGCASAWARTAYSGGRYDLEIRRNVRTLKKKNWKLVILSGILYFVCQICRTDLSACMVDLLPDLGIEKDAMGLAITAGYIAYAVGMSINSLLTDRTNPRLMICAAMFCCAATHLGIRLLPYLPVMIVLWCVNGYAQSAVWPSIVRLTADNLPAERQEDSMRIIALFQHAGSLSCYLIVPAELALGGWRTAMTITSAACLTLGLVWFLMRDLRAVSQTSEKQKNNAAKLNWQFFRKGKLFYFMGVACLTGMIRDGLRHLAAQLLKHRLEHHARPAPGSPEIEHNGLFGLQYLVFKVLFCNDRHTSCLPESVSVFSIAHIGKKELINCEFLAVKMHQLFFPGKRIAARQDFPAARRQNYSTVTLFARFRGLSMSQPRWSAT